MADDKDKALLASLLGDGEAALDEDEADDYFASPSGRRLQHILIAVPQEIEAPKTSIEVEIDAEVMAYLVVYLYERVDSAAPWLERRKLRRVVNSSSPGHEPPILAFTRTVREILIAHSIRWQAPFRLVLLDHTDRLEQLALIASDQLGFKHR